MSLGCSGDVYPDSYPLSAIFYATYGSMELCIKARATVILKLKPVIVFVEEVVNYFLGKLKYTVFHDKQGQ